MPKSQYPKLLVYPLYNRTLATPVHHQHSQQIRIPSYGTQIPAMDCYSHCLYWCCKPVTRGQLLPTSTALRCNNGRTNNSIYAAREALTAPSLSVANAPSCKKQTVIIIDEHVKESAPGVYCCHRTSCYRLPRNGRLHTVPSLPAPSLL